MQTEEPPGARLAEAGAVKPQCWGRAISFCKTQHDHNRAMIREERMHSSAQEAELRRPMPARHKARALVVWIGMRWCIVFFLTCHNEHTSRAREL